MPIHTLFSSRSLIQDQKLDPFLKKQLSKKKKDLSSPNHEALLARSPPWRLWIFLVGILNYFVELIRPDQQYFLLKIFFKLYWASQIFWGHLKIVSVWSDWEKKWYLHHWTGLVQLYYLIYITSSFPVLCNREPLRKDILMQHKNLNPSKKLK